MTNRETTSLEDQKAALRKTMSGIRKEAALDLNAAGELAEFATALLEIFKPQPDSIVAGYWPIRTELDPRPLMQKLAMAGLVTSLPATPEPGKPLNFHLWREGDPVIDGLYGTSEPGPDSPQCAPDILLVPMLAFDDDCFRLGYGGGFYDRSLAVLRQHKQEVRAVGIAFASQRVQHVPRGEHDARLDAVLTPEGFVLPEQGVN
ncbi:5-formyltetrahydrofolate cyclo-ligase [Alphaproteobacteria bacterium LSUCC0684]